MGSFFLERIDSGTGAVSRVLTVGGACGEPTADGAQLWWATDGCTNPISDVDTGSQSIVTRVDVGGPAFLASAGLGSIWVVTGNNELVRIDPAAHSITEHLPFPPG